MLSRISTLESGISQSVRTPPAVPKALFPALPQRLSNSSADVGLADRSRTPPSGLSEKLQAARKRRGKHSVLLRPQKRTCVRGHRHLFDNEQTACMEASKLHRSSFNHELLRSWSCKRRTASIAVAFARLERQR